MLISELLGEALSPINRQPYQAPRFEKELENYIGDRSFSKNFGKFLKHHEQYGQNHYQ